MAKIRIEVKQKKLLVAALVGVFIILGVVSWVYFISPTKYTGEEPQVSDFTSTLGNIEATAAGYLNNGDIEGGLKYYDEQIESRKDKSEQKALWTSKSNFARMAGRSDVAINSASQANDISPDVTATRAMAQAYMASGDKEKALIYYKKLLEMRQAEEGETNPNKLAESREETLGSIIRRLEE